jgi:Flp pilus assembly protein TadG
VEQPEQSPEAVSDEKAKQEGRKMRTKSSFLKDSRGSVAAITIIMMVAFFALVAIVVDLGRLMLVRGQLQHAADAGALAGAEALYYNSTIVGPAWTPGQTAAVSAVQKNKADTLQLSAAAVQTGYWDTTWSPLTAPATLLAKGIVPGPTDAPGVKVSVQKIAGSNSGAVTLTFGQIFGITTVNVAAHATAIASGPVTMPPGTLFPLAINSVMEPDFTVYNSASNPVYIGSNYHYPTDQAGQWTSLGADENNVPFVQGLMSGGNPIPLSQGGPIWIEPGTKDTLFKDANAYAGTTVNLPVVDDTANGGAMTTHAEDPIVGFVRFYIIAGTGGSSKDVEGYFVGGLIVPGNGNSGGAYYAPRLVQ